MEDCNEARPAAFIRESGQQSFFWSSGQSCVGDGDVLSVLKTIGERTITLDCDVLQADGGTRTASITGAWVALADAMDHLTDTGKLKVAPVIHQVASVSVGLKDNEALLDLDYAEDSTADTDMNFVMNDENRFIEVQGTAEHQAFSESEMQAMTQLAIKGIQQLMAEQKTARKASCP